MRFLILTFFCPLTLLGEALGADDFVIESYRLKESVISESNGSITVAGKVKHPGVIQISTSPTPLSQVLRQAGGITRNRYPRYIHVRRGKSEYLLRNAHVDALPEDSLLLLEGDAVFVGSSKKSLPKK